MQILLADDHVLFREALITFIQAKQPDWVIQTASDMDETLPMIASQDFDLILLDLRMPGMNNFTGLKTIKCKYPDIPIAILSGVATDTQVRQAIALGAKAYLPKTISGKALIKAIDLIVNSDQRFIPMDETGLQIMPSYYDGRGSLRQDHNDNKHGSFANNLTKRESETLRYVSQGLSNKDIASKMDLQPTTIKVYVANLCKKLGVENRTQVAILSLQNRLDTQAEKTSA